MTEPWVSVDDVAEHLGVAKDSVYRWIDSKGLPAHRIGKLWKLKLSAVDAWVVGGGVGTATAHHPAGRRAPRRQKGASR